MMMKSNSKAQANALKEPMMPWMHQNQRVTNQPVWQQFDFWGDQFLDLFVVFMASDWFWHSEK